MIDNPLEFYISQQQELELTVFKLKKQLIAIGVFRLFVFLITFFLIYLTFGMYPDVFILGFLGICAFSFLVIQYSNLKRAKDIVEAKIEICKTEIKVLQDDFFHLDNGVEFLNHNHFYSNDIDLFGKGSFFQYTNRTKTIEGKHTYAKLLTENIVDTIGEKQKAIEELSEKVNWRQHFSALASLVNVKNKSSLTKKWLIHYKTILPKYLSIIQSIFSLISLVLLGLVFFSIISFSYLLCWFFIGLFITGSYVKKTTKLYVDTNDIRAVFKQYYPLLREIEKESFDAKNLLEQQKIIQSEHKKASKIFKEFSKILDAFDNRNNIIIAVLGNGLFLVEIYNTYRIEKWINKYKHTVEKWFEVVAYFDAQNSLANFKFNHPTYVFPQLKDTKRIIQATSLGHPLLKANKRVANDFNLNDEQFFIITGANMAGKSTFLRTVSLSIVMANCGLPVCAEKFVYQPIKLITSMRTSDSLSEDESYFYSELKRLKFIVDSIKTEKYFVILDEILKGTNSKDKASGSKQFVEKLTQSKSTGIIATHDVSLCELEQQFTTIKNYYFDAEIYNDELHFDYTLKSGICKNMNASFLLKKMDIV